MNLGKCARPDCSKQRVPLSRLCDQHTEEDYQRVGNQQVKGQRNYHIWFLRLCRHRRVWAITDHEFAHGSIEVFVNSAAAGDTAWWDEAIQGLPDEGRSPLIQVLRRCAHQPLVASGRAFTPEQESEMQRIALATQSEVLRRLGG